MNSTIEFHSIGEINAWSDVKVEWDVEDYVAPGVITSLDGPFKIGKSTVLLQMIAASLHQEPFLGRRTRPRRWVYLSEQTPTTFREPLAQANLLDIGDDDLRVVFWTDVASVPWPVLMEHVKERCFETEAAVVIDTLHQFARLVGDAENEAGSALRVMQPLQELAAGGIPVIAVRHERKGGGSVGEAARGSSATSGVIDILLSLRRLGTDLSNPRRELLGLSRFNSTPGRLVIELGPNGYRLVGGPSGTKATELEEAAERILRLMGDQRMTEAEIRSRAGSTSAVSDALRKVLLQRGLITVVAGKGVRNDPLVYQRDSRSKSFDSRSGTSISDSRSLSPIDGPFSQNEKKVREQQGTAGTSISSNGHQQVDEEYLHALVAADLDVEVGA